MYRDDHALLRRVCRSGPSRRNVRRCGVLAGAYRHTGCDGPGLDDSYAASTSCPSGTGFRSNRPRGRPAEPSKQWSYFAPPGTRIERFRTDYSLVGDESPDGNRSYFFVKRYGQSEPENLPWSAWGRRPAPMTQPPIHLDHSRPSASACSAARTGTCNHAPGQFSRL